MFDSTSLRRFTAPRVLVYSILSGGLLAAADRGAPAVFQAYCFQCHGQSTAMAGVNLEGLVAEPSPEKNFKQWHKVSAVLADGRMPPKGLPAPSDAERARAAGWIEASLDAYAREHAGDPQRVTLRRLTRAEYGYTVLDLTGLEIDFNGELDDDAVGGEGFTNFGDVQFMGDAGLESYLGAAKKVADHAVIGTGPLAFFEDPGQSGFELSAITRIHELYRAHGFRAVAAEGGRAFGLERYAKAFYIAWRYRHREALDEGKLSLDQLAARQGSSPRFIEHVWSVLNQPSPSYPTSEAVALWRELPEPSGPDDTATVESVQAECEEIQKFVINWPRWLFGAGELAAGGAGDERALVITDASLEAQPKQRLQFQERIKTKGKATVYISAAPTDPNLPTSSVVIWRNAQVRARGRDRKNGMNQPLREALDETTRARLNFGRMPDGTAIGENDFAMTGDSSVFFEVAIPETAGGFSMTVEADLADASGGNAVLRLLVSESEAESAGRPTWALLADPESDGFRRWKADVLSYAASFPQTSHGEPTPSDRDPIPEPFDNTYNQDERNRFHQRVKYFRDDAFLVDKMLDDEARSDLDHAWTDLKASFEYHDAFFDFIKDRFALGLGAKSIVELTDDEIEAMPVEPRKFSRGLHRDYFAVQVRLEDAEARHLDDSLRFAERAWRRPVSESEQQGLRNFYRAARENFELDHVRAIRALLTRILTAPEFIYRVERPAVATGAAPLNSWETASRLSYFLWSSAPDVELRRAAEAGELVDEAKLQAQVRRMLADPKSRRLAVEFFGQWLGFYRFDLHRGVDAERFPEFTEEVRAAMYDEAVSFFEHVIRRDRPIREIFSADYAFLNQALVKHYGIEDQIEAGDQVELVENADAFHRGGMMRLGAVLTATSAPLRTSPVKRGDWVLRRVLGTPTPPPPADAGELPADDQEFGGQTIREQLQAHQRNPTCAACHSRIDPLGFPLEHFDAIGRWRDEYEDGNPIEDVAALADRTEIAGIDGLLGYLEQQEPQVLRMMGSKLLGYALGRTVAASDQPLIDRLASAGGDARFADLAIEIVTSKQFRFRRGLEDLEHTSSEPEQKVTAGAGGL